MSGFSTGPWVSSDRTDHHEIYSSAYPGRPIAHADSYWQGDGPRKDERDANARLIAAAPELYEAAEKFLSAWTAGDNKDEEARAAIELGRALRKARGEA